MFRDVKKDKKRNSIFPTSEIRKEKLETVPTNEEIEDIDNALFKIHNEMSKGLSPITFFDMDIHHNGYSISTIMTLPLELQGIDNINMFRDSNILNALTNGDLLNLDRNSRSIQKDNIYGLILECIVTNFDIFATNAPSIDIFDIENNGDIRRKLSGEFGMYIYNNINGCMESLRSHIQHTCHGDIFSIAACDPNTYYINDNHVNRVITIMNAISKQVNEIVAYIICYFMDMFVHNTIISMNDKEIAMCIDRVYRSFSINSNLKLKNRIDFRSFASEVIRADILTILKANIIPNIDHICDNSFLTSYYIYRDLYNERSGETQK